MVCSVRSRACFPLSGSSLSSRCSISGASGMSSLSLMLRALEYDSDALDNEPKLTRSLSLSLDSLLRSVIGLYLFLSGISAPLAGATGAMLALLALVLMASHVVMGGSKIANERRVGTWWTCDTGARPPLSSCCVAVRAGVGGPLPLGGKFVPCYCGGACCCSCISLSCSCLSDGVDVSWCWSNCCNVVVSHRFLELRSAFDVHCSGFISDSGCMVVL